MEMEKVVGTKPPSHESQKEGRKREREGRGGREDIGSREEEKEGRRMGGKEGRHIFVLKVNPRNHK